MECWIASFPRSGNTFFRNILFYVYGIESSTWHRETSYSVDENYTKFRFVKTHLLPSQLIPSDPSIPAIYLVRDGRDAVVSIAHHRKDIVDPGSDFLSNLHEAIVAAEGSFFGGWSKNAEEWIQRAQLIIRYEDLVADPEKEFARVEKIISMPPADWSRLPRFDEMKSGKPKYGGNSTLVDPRFKPEEFSRIFFRKGKAGAWKDDMSSEYQDLFWNYHGNMMERLGYANVKGSLPQNPVLDFQVMKKLGLPVPTPDTEKTVYIEATKVADHTNDGIKRYVTHLIEGLVEVLKLGEPSWQFRLVVANNFLDPVSYKKQLFVQQVETIHPYERVLLGFKKIVKTILPRPLYNQLSSIYRKTSARDALRSIRQFVSSKSSDKFRREMSELAASIDLIHIPLPQDIENYKWLDHSYIVTVHDLTHRLFPAFHEKKNINLAEEGMQFILDKHATVITVSSSTTADLEKLYPVERGRVDQIYEAPDRSTFRWNMNKGLASKIREKYKLGDKPYFLSLSTIEPRKNLPNTIKAFNKLIEEDPRSDINLVIAGKFGWKTEHLELNLDNARIIFTGYIDDPDLHVIYSEAVALCYVSHYEGFGLPPLEAMSCRTPVIFGNNSSMKEIIGETGLAADSNDIDDIKRQMQKLYYDNDFRNELAIRSHHRSFEFSERKFIFDTLQAYRKACGNKK